MHLIFYSPQTLPSIGGLQYVVHYWAEALIQRGHKVTVITDTPSSEVGAAPSPLRWRAGEGGRSASSHNGVGEWASPPLAGGPGGAPSDSFPNAGVPVKPSSSPLRGRAGEGVESPTHAVEPVRILRRASFVQQLRAMRAADCIVMFNVSLKGLPAVLLSGKPFYISHHTALWYDRGPRPFRQRFKQWVANHLAKDNCACSAYIANLYKNCRVIHSPYHEAVFIPGNSKRKPGSILFAGRLVSDKGADLLIKACGLLKKEGLPFSLTMVGDGPDGAKLLALAESLELDMEDYARYNSEKNKSVNSRSENATANTHTGSPPAGESEGASPTIPGGDSRGKRREGTKFGRGALSQPSLAHLMQTHQILVVPSRMEPMGMVIAEGLASGCRMVVSNQGGMPEVGGPFCRYFESGSVDSLADALRQQLLNPLPVDEALLKKHLAKFTIEYSVDELEKWLG